MDTSAWGDPASSCRPDSTLAQRVAPACLPRHEAIRAEQIRLLYANAPAGFVATALNAGLLALTQWPVIPPPVLLAWLASVLVLTGLRAVLVWHFQRAAPAPPAMGPWSTLFGLGTALAGLAWGAAGVVLFPSTSLPHQVFLTFVVGGMIAGAIGLLAARMPVFVSFACPAAVPVIVQWLTQGNLLASTMGGMAALFTLVSVVTASKLHHSIRASVQLRFENRDLVASVTAEKARVESLNAHLTTEIAERQRAEAALRTAHDALEARVRERTATLTTTLTHLQAALQERQQAEEQLSASLQEKEVLLKEIHHRVKNNLQIISSLLSLQSETITDPRLLAQFQDGQHRVRSMALVHETLYQSGDLARLDMAPYMQILSAQLLQSYDVAPPGIAVRLHVDPVWLDLDQAIPCGLIVNELLTNAFKYAFPANHTGVVEVVLHCVTAQQARLVVRDTGVGFPHDLDFRHTTTLGLQLVCMLTEQLDGTITLERDGGTVFTVTFPVVTAPAPPLVRRG